MHIFLNLFTKNIHDLARYLNDGFFVVQYKSEWARIDVINPEFKTLLISVMNSGLRHSKLIPISMERWKIRRWYT